MPRKISRPKVAKRRNAKAKIDRRKSTRAVAVEEEQAPYRVEAAKVPDRRTPLVSVSLFSGGGLDIGVEDAGFKNLVSVEWDENAVETLRQNAARKGGVTRVIHADIRNIDPLEIARPGIDLLHGGPPCQAFSLIGKRDSLGDYRGLLLFEMIRFAKALKPRAVLLEQVKGLLSAPDENGERGGVFKRFTQELGALGYTVKWSVLCAAD